MMPQLFDAFKERAGYRLRPSIVWKIIKENGEESLVLGMVNDGRANPPGKVCFEAESNGERTEKIVSGGCFAGSMYLAEIPLGRHHNNVVTLRMALRIRDKVRPMRFAADTGKGEAPLELTIRLEHEI